MQDINKQIGKRIRLMRQLRGWSQERLADSSAIHRSHMGQIERGEHNVTVATLQRVGSALHVSVSGLLRGVR